MFYRYILIQHFIEHGLATKYLTIMLVNISQSERGAGSWSRLKFYVCDKISGGVIEVIQ